eukprot:10908758-Ditylum_brightwellii.AAC.1
MTNYDEMKYAPVVDKIRAMMHSETATYSFCGSYLTQGIGEDWRLKVCKWAYDVVDYFKYDREAVGLAMNYLDRFMDHSISNGLRVSKKCFQLSAIACILIAMKIEGRNEEGQSSITIHTLVDLSC